MPFTRPRKLDESYSEAIYVMMAKFGWTLDEIKELPIPSFFEIVKLMEKEAKEQEKEMKHGHR